MNEGTDVVVMGWVVTVRGHGNIVFATIRDKLGNIQVITKSGECEDDIREKLSHLKEHSSIAVVGKTRKNEKSPTGIEVVPNEMRVFSEVEKIPPFEPYAKTVKNIGNNAAPPSVAVAIIFGVLISTKSSLLR